MRKLILILVFAIVGVFFINAQAFAEIAFNSEVRVDDGVGSSWNDSPAMATDNNGNVYVVWTNGDIYIAKSTDGGATYGASVRVDDTGAAGTIQKYPDIAVASNGDICVVWEDWRNVSSTGYYDVYFAKSSDGGATFSANVCVTSIHLARPAVAVGTGGDIYVVGHINPDIYFTRSANGGASFDAPVKVSNSPRGYEAFSKIAVGPSGDIYVVWLGYGGDDDSYDVFLAKSTDGGSSFGSTLQVNDVSTGRQSPSSIITDSEGYIYVVWSDGRDIALGDDIYLAKSTDAGASFGTSVRMNDLTSGVQKDARLALGTNGEIYASWNSEGRTYLSRSIDGGSSFGSSVRVAPTLTCDQPYSAITADKNRNIYVSWSDTRGGENHIYAAKATDGWVLNLTAVPWYENVSPRNSTGAAASQMILNYLRTGAGMSLLTDQAQIYEYAKSPSPFGPDLTADEVAKALNNFDPAGYNFCVMPGYDPLNKIHYMGNICHWMAYTVPGVALPHAPGILPIYGTYDHWVTVKGCATTADPWTSAFTIYGYWFRDPLVTGLGQDAYKTAAVCASDYFLPLVSTDQYNGKLVHVIEPPYQPLRAKVSIASATPDDANLVFMGVKAPAKTKLLNGILKAALGVKPPVIKKGWQDILPQQLLGDKECKVAFVDTKNADPILVKRPDAKNSDYYLLSFVKKNIRSRYTMASGVIVIDAVTGAFKEATWAKNPEKFLKVNDKEAVNLIIDYLNKDLKNRLDQFAGRANLYKRQSLNWAYDKLAYYVRRASTELLWSPKSAYSKSPYHPYWKVNANGYIFYVTQEGKVVSEPDLAKIIAEILANKRILKGL